MVWNNTVSGEEPISPVTLHADWSRVARLLLVTAMTVAGCVGNVFMISAVVIEDHLRVKGNSFLVNVALADLVITGIVMPATVIALLADLPEASQKTVCTAQWPLSLVSCLVTLLTLAGAALENFFRLCYPACHDSLSPCRITLILVAIWVTVCIAVTVQTVLRLGPDYCQRTSQGLVPYQVGIGLFLVVIPAVTTIFCYTLLACRVRAARTVREYRSQISHSADFGVVKTNIISFIVFVIFWLPFGTTLVMGPVQSISRSLFYNLAWFALSKSCVNNLVYCATNRYFRSAYINLFHYCCCKTTVSFSRRAREPVRPPGDVRVHIIPAYNMNYSSPGRAREAHKGSGKRSTVNRPIGRPNGRDVYEL